MRFALFNGERIEAERGSKGAQCPLCEQSVIAKCGSKRLHHWARKGKIECDKTVQRQCIVPN